MTGWKEHRLGDIINVKHGFAFKGENFSEIPTTDILLTPGNFKIGGGFKSDKFKYYDGEVPPGYVLQEGDVIITMTDLSKEGDTLGYSAKIPTHRGIRYLHNQRLGLLEIKDKNFSKDFIYWVLRTNTYQKFIVSSATGTTVKHTSPSRIGDYLFRAPNLPTQTAIAEIVSSLDDKIELNNQINKELEALAQALFKHWFIDFEFPNEKGKPYRSSGGKMFKSGLGEIPKGWQVSSLRDHIEATRGLSYKGSGLSDPDNGIPMVNLNSVYEGGGYKWDGLKYYSGDYRDRHIIKPGEIAVTNTEQGHKYLLIGYPAMVPDEIGEFALFSHHIYRVTTLASSPLTNQFINHLLLQSSVREQVIGAANGTTVNMLKIDGLETPKFIVPTKDLCSTFTKLASNCWNLIQSNQAESKRLNSLRDELLPRLISGQLQVK